MFENDLNDFINNQNSSYPFIKEISYSNDIRKIKISGQKSLLIAVIVLLCVQAFMILIGFTVFKDIKPLKILFCIMELPFLFVLLIAPANAICKYDYNSKTFISYVVPIIPIPYMCFSSGLINFNEISGFFIKKRKL